MLPIYYFRNPKYSRKVACLIVNFGEISHCSGVSIVDLEHVYACWENC